MKKSQTIYLAAPGFQSVDNWLPVAIKQLKYTDDDVVLLFPYFWVLEIIPKKDLLIQLIKENRIPIGLPLFGTSKFLLFQSIDTANTYIKFARSIKTIFEKHSDKSSISHKKRLSSVITMIFCSRFLSRVRFLKFKKTGVLVWDLINIQAEQADQLRHVSKRTKGWKRISINVSPIYAERPKLDYKYVTADDYLVSFSKEQTKLMREQYGILEENIYCLPVPRHDQSWIKTLRKSSSQITELPNEYVLLVSRGEDPPLLTYDEKMRMFAAVIEQVCVKKSMKLLVKLHPNENQSSFANDLEYVRMYYNIDQNILNDVLLTHEHILVVASYAQFGIAYFSGTIADMVRVGCPAIQFLIFNAHDSRDTNEEKLLLDKGMAELVKSIEMLEPTIDKLLNNKSEFLQVQWNAYINYFYSPNSDSTVSFPIQIVSGSI